MGMVRTNITLPAEVLELVDAVAGPRGRSGYIADIVARQVRRDNARVVFAKYKGALRGSTTWGRTDEEVLENLRGIREEWDRRVDEKWGVKPPDEVPAGLDGADRPQPRPSRRR